MPKLIKDGAITDDHWQLIDKDTVLTANDIDGEKQLLLPLSLWLALREEITVGKNIGVWLDSDEAPSALADDCQKLALIAINFPSFADGRGYSYAVTLRQRDDYRGALRAIGDVLRDQLFFYQRCGFNSYAVRSDCDISAALAGLNDFDTCYQAAQDETTPLFRKR